MTPISNRQAPVTRLTDPAAVQRWLEDDRRWCAYALADLEEPFWSHAAFWVTAQPAPAVLLHLALPSWAVLWGHGAPAGLAAIVPALPSRPRAANLMLRAEALPEFARWYDFGEIEPMRRMVVTPATFWPASGAGAVRLHDPEELTAFYAGRAPGYDPAQVTRGIYYGVREADGRLCAAAGTHAVSPRAGLGIVGNVFTEPAARGQGLGRRVTAAVVTALFEQGCREILLNVRADNIAALSVYTRLGFETHCDFVETVATARPARSTLPQAGEHDHFSPRVAR
ncbi:MAG: GNAT family N-acetyltransferase [Ardenticatenaceae bacterium]|nr:GNAT family N-acetyltransferase [Ardenticatenaceae bacterium]HBY95022.1 hypothetical protein [Chloroflexota bacterium]